MARMANRTEAGLRMFPGLRSGAATIHQGREVNLSKLPVAMFCFLSVGLALADEKPAAAPDIVAAKKAALAPFNSRIGKWNGVGQPRRASNQGAWQEKAEWIWDFSGHDVAVRIDVADGKLAKTLRLGFDPATKQYVGTLIPTEGAEETYRGKFETADKLALTAIDGDEVRQISITLLNEKRTLILFEKKLATASSFNRVAEVGYTRDGARLATSASSGPECIVTGGTGTIEVKYKGQTYYVCCTGCKQAFQDDPEGIIAEAAERRKREREKAAK
jgi:YHS domain-containing protein